MKWWEKLWSRKKTKTLEQCKTIEDMMTVLTDTSNNKKKLTPLKLEINDPFALFGLPFAWIPALCCLNPWYSYESDTSKEFHIFFPKGQSSIRINSRILASILALIDMPILCIISVIYHTFLSLYLPLHIGSFIIGLLGVKLFGFRLHPELRGQPEPNQHSLKTKVSSFMNERIASARERMVGASSMLIQEIAKNQTRMQDLERKHALFSERLQQGSIIAAETLKKIDDGLETLRQKDAILRARENAIRDLLAKAEARVATQLPLFDDHEELIATTKLLEGIEHTREDLARIHAHLMQIVREEFGLIERVIEGISNRAYALPVHVDEQALKELAGKSERTDIDFTQSMRALETELIEPVLDGELAH